MSNFSTQFETENYIIQIGKSELGIIDKNPDATVYKLVNKATGLTEAEGVSLPESIFYLLNREATLKEALQVFELGEIPGAHGHVEEEVH